MQQFVLEYGDKSIVNNELTIGSSYYDDINISN
jgi:hypothetical protein